jgi:hypothetical protein
MFEKLGKTIDQFFHSLGNETSLTRIDAKTETISAPYPEGNDVQLRVVAKVGKLEVTPGGDRLVDGTVTYNVEEWTPSVVTEGDKVTVDQELGMHVVGSWQNVVNDWKLAVGTARPFALSVSKGAGESTIELGSVPLVSATLEMGAGKAQVGFAKPNPAACSSVKVQLGAGTLVVNGLLDANTERFSFDGGAGELTLGFTGERLQRSMTAVANAGAGKVVVNVKRGVPCQVKIKKLLGGVRTQGGFNQTDSQVYETTGFGSASGPVLRVEINTPVSDIILNQVD